MKDFAFTISVSKTPKRVVIFQPNGGGLYFLFMDNYYQGTMVNLNGSWIGNLNIKSELTGDNIEVLGKMIEGESGLDAEY